MPPVAGKAMSRNVMPVNWHLTVILAAKRTIAMSTGLNVTVVWRVEEIKAMNNGDEYDQFLDEVDIDIKTFVMLGRRECLICYTISVWCKKTNIVALLREDSLWSM